jgi:hypothetical protein
MPLYHNYDYEVHVLAVTPFGDCQKFGRTERRRVSYSIGQLGFLTNARYYRPEYRTIRNFVTKLYSLRLLLMSLLVL